MRKWYSKTFTDSGSTTAFLNVLNNLRIKTEDVKVDGGVVYYFYIEDLSYLK